MMEEKDEMVVLKDVPDDHVVTTIPNMKGEVDPLEDVIIPQDYSKFSKKDLVDLLKEVAIQNDFKRTDSVLKEIKSQFDEILDKEKSDALKRFIDSGGSPDDFDYRADTLDVSFEAQYKLLKDRKTEHFKNLEGQKSENLQKKNALLEDLRNLVDGEDNKHSFERFKEIQQHWKLLGAVPSLQIQPLWASYHVLVDRFYDNRNIYFELKELDRRKNLEAKLELCQRVEKLALVQKIGEAVRELNELHEEYKHIGPVARELKDGLWDRFKSASDAVYARRDASVIAMHQELAKNLVLKVDLVNEIGAFPAFQSDRIKEWNDKTAGILAIQKRWEDVGAIPHSKSRDINKKFWATFKTFFNNKGQFFKKLDQYRVQNLTLKKELVQQAEALKASQEWDHTANELKKLQVKWKEIGPVPEKYRDKIFLEFKAACDFFFEQRRLKLEEADKEQLDNLRKKEAICATLEQMVADKTGTLGQLKDLQRSFRDVGFVPIHSVSAVKARFAAAMDKFLASLDQVSQDEKDNALLEIQLENLKSDPDASHKIHQREQTLKKRIASAENDLAILKNNLEFFGRSKNADKMRAEFGGKIKVSTEELEQLKKQLKVIKAAH